ncbi:hypothetical protein scyTo_0023822, partial [Scyliorhinus torazame]|nr:hypothetical protein [Scyliorhinus torazame]
TEEEIVKSLVIFIEQLNIDLLDSRKTRSKTYTGTIKADVFSIAYRQFLELVRINSVTPTPEDLSQAVNKAVSILDNIFFRAMCEYEN